MVGAALLLSPCLQSLGMVMYFLSIIQMTVNTQVLVYCLVAFLYMHCSKLRANL